MNHVRDKCLIVYYSASGNTKGVTKIIEQLLDAEGKYFDVLPLQIKNNNHDLNIEQYDHVFIGTPTYGEGLTPNPVLDLLRYLLKHNEFDLPPFSVFGTGDTQWATYCKAVDEVEYHLSKKTMVVEKLKIEQYPISDNQINKINKFVEMSIGR